MPNREGANTLMRRNGWSQKLIASWRARAAFASEKRLIATGDRW
jgi:hypothetical protein